MSTSQGYCEVYWYPVLAGTGISELGISFIYQLSILRCVKDFYCKIFIMKVPFIIFLKFYFINSI